MTKMEDNLFEATSCFPPSTIRMGFPWNSSRSGSLWFIRKCQLERQS